MDIVGVGDGLSCDHCCFCNHCPICRICVDVREFYFVGKLSKLLKDHVDTRMEIFELLVSSKVKQDTIHNVFLSFNESSVREINDLFAEMSLLVANFVKIDNNFYNDPTKKDRAKKLIVLLQRLLEHGIKSCENVFGNKFIAPKTVEELVASLKLCRNPNH